MGSCLSRSVEADIALPETKKHQKRWKRSKSVLILTRLKKKCKTDSEIQSCSIETREVGTDSDISGEEGSDTSGEEESENILSPQQIDELEEETLEKVRLSVDEVNTVENYDNVKEDGNFPIMTEWLTYLSYIYCYGLEGAPVDRVTFFRKTVAKILIETKAIELICEIYKYYVKNGWKVEGDGEIKADKTKWKSLELSAVILLNFSDASDELAIYIANYRGLLDTIRYVIVEEKEAHLKGEEEQEAAQLCANTLTLSHNIAMRDADVTILRALDFTSAVQPYLKSLDQNLRLCALGTLASIVDEKESEIINANRDTVGMLLQYLQKGSEKPKRRYDGWSCKELAYIVRKLARNDANQKMLSDLGAVDILVKVGQTGNEEEIYEVIQALWVLAFDPDIRKMMVGSEEIGLVDLLLKVYQSNHKPAIKKACSGALWTVREELTSSPNEKYRQLGHLQERDPSEQDLNRKSKTMSAFWTESQEGVEQRHIMISYQWADQKTLIQIKDRLKASGFKVWMDIDQMAGSTLQSMAEAVENADIFLMAMSHKYKDSPNCRAEAEYAFTKHKKIIPLKMEKEYNADGWLGIILGAKLFYEFNGKYPFANKMRELLKEIKMFMETIEGKTAEGRVKRTNVEQVTKQPEDADDSRSVFTPVTVSESVFKTTIAKVRKWKSLDVQDWINRNSLDRYGLSVITGEEVALLLKMLQEAPEFFYKCLQSTLNVNDLLTTSKIVWALNDLVESTID